MQGIASDPRVLCWLEAYRDLLDQWQLFTERAKFDVDRLQALGGKVRNNAPMHVCNVVGRSVCAYAWVDAQKVWYNTDRDRWGA